MEKNLDKMFLLTYTADGGDGFSRFHHAWFRTEEELRAFVQEKKAGDEAGTSSFEVDLAIEVLDYRSVEL